MQRFITRKRKPTDTIGARILVGSMPDSSKSVESQVMAYDFGARCPHTSALGEVLGMTESEVNDAFKMRDNLDGDGYVFEREDGDND